MSNQIKKYELNQPQCILRDNLDIIQINTYLSRNLVKFLKNMSTNLAIEINIIGSPSDAGIVFKLTFNDITIEGTKVIQCYALKIMPYTIEQSNNDNEIYFTNLLSNINNNQFAMFYFSEPTIFNFGNSDSVIGKSIEEWYNVSNAGVKIEKHKKLYNEVRQYNTSIGINENLFNCDIMVSRMYWGDLIVFINNPIKSFETDEASVTFTRCKNIDLCGRLNNLKINVKEWQKFMIGILRSIKIMRDNNIIHNDLHCGNILLDFDGTPIIHDFGKTLLYNIPTNKDQLYYGDTTDFRKLLNSLRLEIYNGTLNDEVTYYLNELIIHIEDYIKTLYNIHQPVDEINLKEQIIDRRTIIKRQPDISEELRLLRNKLFLNLIKLINTKYTKPEFNLIKMLNKYDIDNTYEITPNISKEHFQTKRKTFIRKGKKHAYDDIISNWKGGNSKKLIKSKKKNNKKVKKKSKKKSKSKRFKVKNNKLYKVYT